MIPGLTVFAARSRGWLSWPCYSMGWVMMKKQAGCFARFSPATRRISGSILRSEMLCTAAALLQRPANTSEPPLPFDRRTTLSGSAGRGIGRRQRRPTSHHRLPKSDGATGFIHGWQNLRYAASRLKRADDIAEASNQIMKINGVLTGGPNF